MSPPDPDEPETIADRIRRARPTLTPSHQQIADYVLAHMLQAATMPIDELAAAVGVSIATANRFARAVGLGGYPELRAELVRGFEAMLAPIEKMRSRIVQPSSVREVFDAVLEESQRNIAATRNALDSSACEAAVAAIVRARRIYIVGFGSSGWLAGLLQWSLDKYCNDAQLLASVAGASYAARQLPRMRPDDLLITISYPRYMTDAVVLTRDAFERGVQVLALTDGPHSPLRPYAHVCLFATANNQYAPSSDSSALALIEALSSAIAHQAAGPVQAAARMTEAMAPWLHDGRRSRLTAVAPPKKPAATNE